ncbi:MULTISPECIES: NADPH-dependent FMN reductase [Demequina]|uniref:NADPH-dependent oxidoreductase n=1 Tax=Demequina litorisediminis TaxID=1849022 RepID=A0ABQ6IC27_9MICO|nr:NADPH-dependent FMN reductase [Demequina litorisediminis]GMA34552.1 NADPH-dependent oxidoreductase [Demequina litorisediminis]
MTRIGIIVGSIAEASINRQVANVLPGLATDEDVEFTFLEFKDLPFYDYALDADYPQVARDWKQAIADVDGVIIVTPEYSRSIPGVLKNALDWAARPWGQGSFAGKPVAIMGASIGSTATAAAQQHLRAILGHYDAPTMGQPETFFHYRADAFGADGTLQDEAQASILANFVNAAVAHVKQFARVSA